MSIVEPDGVRITVARNGPHAKVGFDGTNGSTDRATS